MSPGKKQLINACIAFVCIGGIIVALLLRSGGDDTPVSDPSTQGSSTQSETDSSGTAQLQERMQQFARAYYSLEPTDTTESLRARSQKFIDPEFADMVDFTVSNSTERRYDRQIQRTVIRSSASTDAMDITIQDEEGVYKTAYIEAIVYSTITRKDTSAQSSSFTSYTEWNNQSGIWLIRTVGTLGSD